MKIQCDEELAYQLLQNINIFNSTFVTDRGFDFANACQKIQRVPNALEWFSPGPSKIKVEKCCGEYPQR